MPNQPKTPLHSMRIPDHIWEAVKARSEREGTSITAVVVARLAEYADEGDADR